MNKKITYLFLYLVLVISFTMRIFGMNWDQGGHLHPDERAIVLSVTGLHLPISAKSLLSPESTWNTHFFAYGNFPFYLLRVAGDIAGNFDQSLSTYDGIQLVGRFLSALFDTGTVLLLFFLGRKIWKNSVGLLAAFFYGVSVLPIQLSHFFAVDTILTFFITLLLLLLLSFYENPSRRKSVALGIALAFALTTKVSSLVLLATIGITLVLDFILIFLSAPHKVHVWKHHLPNAIRSLFSYGLIMLIASITAYLLISPYTLIDFTKFQQQTLEQSQMTKNAYTFPYTLQYVTIIPYLYELKNIILWGLGPLLSLFCFSGFFLFLRQTIQVRGNKQFAFHSILLVFIATYFGIVGGFAVGFMRYMLPLYPLLCLFGALILYRITQIFPFKRKLFAIGYLLLALLFFIWPLSFLHIYSVEHTRITASNWIHANIPAGKTIAVEHWDDSLPLSGIESYTVLTYPLYEPDTPEKWSLMQNYLAKTDYIIIASNRLYVPLQKLTDCEHLPPLRCYVRTDFYYKSLFNGSLGFKKVVEFSDPPTIPVLNITIDDQRADESFTVYDHPKIMIFKRNASS